MTVLKMRKLIISSLLALSGLVLKAQDNAFTNRTVQIASYKIDAKLDTDAKMISASEILTWKNNTQDTIADLMFHTYLNAFKNSKSTYFIESERECGYNLSDDFSDSDWGYVDILRMTIDGEPLTPDLKYVHPDTNNEDDRTVMKVKLPKKILPGKEITLNITFLSKLPRILARTGYERGDFFMAAQWFPKIGVYETKGTRGRKSSGWNCHEYHFTSEFYADFGSYDVSINVPEKYVVGATGVETYNATIGDGTKTYKFFANDVIDFAWTASPRYNVMLDSFNNKGIKLLYMPEHSSEAERYVKAVKFAMEYMQKNVGEYPYTQITMADCPFYARGAAGMEYPMFITVHSNRHSGIHETESVAIHEFVHQYFMAAVANNESEEAWLDEGITYFYEGEIMDAYFGEGSQFNFLGFKKNASEKIRLGYTQSYNPAIASINNFTWRYPSHTYQTMAYNKPATMMQTLKGMLGEENFNATMKNYYEKYKFKHPCSQDFFSVVNQNVAKMNDPVFGKDLNWFFRSAFMTDEVCDYKLTKIVNSVVKKSDKGFFDDGLDKILGREDAESVIKSSVYVQRMGTMVMPVEVLVTFKNGETQTVKWDGRGRCKEFVFTGNSSVVSAHLDPQNKIKCDTDLINNSISYENDSQNPIWKYASKFLFWVENVFQTVFFFA
jgi:hypothetical protein